MQDVWLQAELVHALILWETQARTAGDGELPTWAEVGGLSLWLLTQRRIEIMGFAEALACQFVLARSYVAEAAHNYGRPVGWVREQLRCSCTHPHFWGVDDSWLDGLE